MQQMKKLVLELLKYDASIVFHSIENDKDLLYPQYDPFLLKEKDFTLLLLEEVLLLLIDDL